MEYDYRAGRIRTTKVAVREPDMAMTKLLQQH